MINIKAELENFPQIDLNDLNEKGIEIQDSIKNAIYLYNKAIESLRMGSEDIAIIGLKKAISIHPDFHEAINLLGLCYAYIRDYDRAAQMFERVTKAENNALLALKYMTKMNESEDIEQNKSVTKKKPGLLKNKVANSGELSIQKKEANKLRHQAENKIETNNKIETKDKVVTSPFPYRTLQHKSGRYNFIGGFVAGVVITGIISFILYSSLPAGTQAEKGDMQSLANDFKKLEKKYSDLNSDYDELKVLYEAANNENNYNRISGKLIEAEQLVTARKYEQAADALLSLKDEKLNDDEKSKCSQLLAKCIPQACQTVYNTGIQLFNKKDYTGAVAKLTKIRTYDDDYKYLNYVLYCLGKSYEQLNDNKSSIDAYQTVIQKFPGTDYAIWSQNRINGINSN